VVNRWANQVNPDPTLADGLVFRLLKTVSARVMPVAINTSPTPTTRLREPPVRNDPSSLQLGPPLESETFDPPGPFRRVCLVCIVLIRSI
ncbi:MAG: hypothetical protein RLZZ440_1690, partial [Planctomycetota bacterium]